MDAPPSVPVWLVQFRLESLAGDSIALDAANALLGEVVDFVCNYVPTVSGSCFPRATVVGDRVCCSIQLGAHLINEESKPDIEPGVVERFIREWLGQACDKRGWSATGWYWHGAWTFGGVVKVGCAEQSASADRPRD